MELVLLGPPGSGKGTQAKRLCQRFDVPHVSTGDLFRMHLGQSTELGQLAKTYMDQGTLVPDDVTEAMVKDRLEQADAVAGFVLDGFPRNLAQGQHLTLMLSEMDRRLKAVLYFKVSLATVMDRITGRRTCSQCGALYHLRTHPPKVSELCDVCGGALVQRADDSEATVKTRMAVYDHETAPLVDFYTKQGLLHTIDAELPVDSVTERLEERLVKARD